MSRNVLLPLDGVTVYSGHGLEPGDLVRFYAPKYPWWVRWYTMILLWNPCNDFVEPLAQPTDYRIVGVTATHFMLEPYD